MLSEEIKNRIDRLDDLQKDFEDCENEIVQSLQEKRVLEKHQQALQLRLKYLESEFLNEVTNEVDPDTQKKKYSNKEQRDFAVAKLMREKPDSVGVREDLLNNTDKLNSTNDAIEGLKYRFRRLQANVEIEKMKI